MIALIDGIDGVDKAARMLYGLRLAVDGIQDDEESVALREMCAAVQDILAEGKAQLYLALSEERKRRGLEDQE